MNEELPKQEIPQVKEKKQNVNWMEFLMDYGWAILVVLIAIGALAYFGVLKPCRFTPDGCELEITTTSSTSTIPTTTIGQANDILTLTACPDQYKRRNPDGSLYCPNPSVFGCKTYKECPVEVEDELFTTTVKTTSTISTSEETTIESTTTTEETSTTINGEFTGYFSKNKKRVG